MHNTTWTLDAHALATMTDDDVDALVLQVRRERMAREGDGNAATRIGRRGGRGDTVRETTADLVDLLDAIRLGYVDDDGDVFAPMTGDDA